MTDIDMKELRRRMEELRDAEEIRRPWSHEHLGRVNFLRIAFSGCALKALPALLSEAEEAERLREELAALRAAPTAEPVADGWRPIETAPKDGTDLFGYRPDAGVFVFRWAEMSELGPIQNAAGEIIEDDGFAWWLQDGEGWLEGDLTPTHWMPLPAAPTEAGLDD